MTSKEASEHIRALLDYEADSGRLDDETVEALECGRIALGVIGGNVNIDKREAQNHA